MARKTTVLTTRVMTLDGPLEVRVIEACGALAITPTVVIGGLSDEEVTITHVRSGLAVRRDLTLARARFLLPKLAAISGWGTASAAEINKNAALGAAVRRIMLGDER